MSKYDQTANTTLSRRKDIIYIDIYSSYIFVLLINFITK